MLRKIFRKIRRETNSSWKAARKYQDINPEDIFLDSTNLPGFEDHRLEGRIEKPVGEKTLLILKITLAVVVLGLVSRLWFLEIEKGAVYTQISENNRLEQTLIFANRGVIYDRNYRELATNAVKDEESDFAGRLYAPIAGVAHTVGYLKYPLADEKGVYYENYYLGLDGVESFYDGILSGTNGLKLRETNVFGEVTSESVIQKPIDGEKLVLSIDSRLSEVLYKKIETLANERGFVGGAGVIIDVTTGEILALTNFPEYDENLLTGRADQETLNDLINNSAKPFLNRVVGGLYTPGSILKPIIALAALNEGVISPTKEILSTGSITVSNPYNPSKPSVFKDWKAHGWTDMRRAIAVSSDTYFYSVGGGYGDQKGLGIEMLDRYFKLFGLDEKTGIDLAGEVRGVIASPEWKMKNFGDDPWRLGDTYITAIGQYGTQITPLNAARFVAAIANGGKLLKTSVLLGGQANPVERELKFNRTDLEVVWEGMREAVIYGTAVGLNVSYVKIAGKTGTAEVGSNKAYVNSWSVGFFPYENPRYAWAVVMEKGPSANLFGATSAVRGLFDWMAINTPEYFAL